MNDTSESDEDRVSTGASNARLELITFMLDVLMTLRRE